jgi:hypothetical protein
MWNALVEEGRENKLKQMPLSRCPEQLPCSTASENDKILTAEAALKVLLLPSIVKFNNLLVSWIRWQWVHPLRVMSRNKRRGCSKAKERM